MPPLVMIEKGKRRGVTQAAREETGHVNYAHKDSLRHPITTHQSPAQNYISETANGPWLLRFG